MGALVTEGLGGGIVATALKHLFDNNAQWVQDTLEQDPDFFERLSQQQAPEYLWIGCADSRVPANQVVGLMPGELFVHRNVANVVVHTDLNLLSVLQFAVEVLKVKHVIVCGHYGCGGVKAAYQDAHLGLIDNWLRHIQNVASNHQELLAAQPDEEAATNKLCELNVVAQVANVCRTTVVADAWRGGQELSVHGFIYGLADGRLRDLGLGVRSTEEREAQCRQAVERLSRGAPTPQGD
ncbi:carbonate dehydratase [Halomonadaceae bacterium KBTZ08]